MKMNKSKRKWRQNDQNKKWQNKTKIATENEKKIQKRNHMSVLVHHAYPQNFAEKRR